MVLMKTLTKRGQLMSVATKIGIQMSAKLGGEIWSVPIPVSRSTLSIDDDYYRSFLFLFLVKKFNDYRYRFVSRQKT